MPSEFDDNGTLRLTGAYRGTVLFNNDPLKVGRVRVSIPGLIDSSDWAWPIGFPGAGNKSRGMFFVPDVGSDVIILFEQGIPDNPLYLAGSFGAPDGKPESAGPVGGTADVDGQVENIAANDVPKVKAIESDRWLMVMDDRAGKEKAYLKDKVTGDYVEIDGVNGGIAIKGTVGISIVADGAIKIDAPHIEIGGRVLVQNSKVLR